MVPSDVRLEYFGYGFAAVTYLLLTIILLALYRDRAGGVRLAAAAFITSVWGVSLCWLVAINGLTPSRLLLLEMMHDGAWILFLSALFVGGIGSGKRWIVRYGGISLISLLILLGTSGGSEIVTTYGLYFGVGDVLVLGSILTSLVGLVAVEQIYRNARQKQKSGLKFLCIAMAAIFTYDLVLYSQAILEGEISDTLWLTKGVVLSLCVPLIMVAVKRSPRSSVGLFVSRHVVFYSATLILAGLYLAVVGIGGQYLLSIGGEWGEYLLTVVTFTALVGLSLVLFSERSRRNAQALISKHFFANRYDYRIEWLRLMDTLAASEEGLPLRKRAIKALAQILQVQSGTLWLALPDSSRFYCAAGWNCAPDPDYQFADRSLTEFLRATGWIIEISEFEKNPDHYDGLELNTSSLGFENPGFIIPLLNHGKLLGLIVLCNRAKARSLVFEDRDLLKTAGQQIASYLAQDLATEKLAEARQFEAFNRLTAYLMHDLKNVIAQQSLIVDNSERHKDKAEFVDDMIETIRGSVRRMRGVIDHFQQRSSEQSLQRIELTKIVLQAVSQAADGIPIPRAQIDERQIWVKGDPERMKMAIFHAVRNAQDASEDDGTINVTLSETDSFAEIAIADQGTGMDEQFVRERLFKPFDSTKGTRGMGIGAYQLRETVSAIGGEIDIDTALGKGTTFHIKLPKVSK